MIIIGGILVLFIYITRLASNEIFSLQNKIHREVGRTKDFYQHPCILIKLQTKLHLRVYRKTTRHSESKECLAKACVLTTEYIIRHLVYFPNLFGIGKHPTKIVTSLKNFVKNNFNPLGTVEV